MKCLSSFIRVLVIAACLFACVAASACSYEPPQFTNLPGDETNIDQPGSFDIYVDSTGPSGFYVQVENSVYYTSQADYERDAPALYAKAAQAGLPVRFVYGQKISAESRSGIEPTWTVPFEAFGYYVTFSSPQMKYVSHCVSQNAYTANLRIHRYTRGTSVSGTQLRDYHLAAYRNIRGSNVCIGLIETQTGYPDWCSCPGTTLRAAYGDLRTAIQRGLQDSGMTVSQASVLAVAMVPLVIIGFSPAGL